MTHPAPTYDRNKEIERQRPAVLVDAELVRSLHRTLQAERLKVASLEAENAQLRGALESIGVKR